MITALCSVAGLYRYLGLDTAVSPLTSAPFPRRKDGNWVFALSPRERDKKQKQHCLSITITLSLGSG